MYLYSYPSTHVISRLAEGATWEEFEVCQEMTIEWTQWYTPRPWLSNFGDALGGSNRAYLEIHLEAVIERVWICTWRMGSSEHRDAVGGRDRASLEMHLEDVIERVWRYTWMRWSSECGQVLGGGRWTPRPDSIHQLVYSQPWVCDKVTSPMKLRWRTGWWRWIGREVHWMLKLQPGVNSKLWEWRDNRQSSVYAVLSVFCTQC